MSGAPKIVTNTARLLARVDAWGDAAIRCWAADCAEHGLPLFERRYPSDTRPRECIVTVRAYLRGEASRDDLLKAQRAAYAAADAADAAYAAYAAYAAADAAYERARVLRKCADIVRKHYPKPPQGGAR